jgi:hypothetical protein
VTPKLRLVALPSAIIAVAVTVAVAGAGTGETPAAAAKKPVEFELHDLYIEYNATAGDAGLQLSADAEDWKRFRLLDTKGKPLIDVGAKGRLHRPFGLSELFLEASEPPITKVPFHVFKKRFPEGVYRFAGVTRTGRRWWAQTGCPTWCPQGRG